jgi:hypothetical protein
MKGQTKSFIERLRFFDVREVVYASTPVADQIMLRVLSRRRLEEHDRLVASHNITLPFLSFRLINPELNLGQILPGIPFKDGSSGNFVGES